VPGGAVGRGGASTPRARRHRSPPGLRGGRVSRRARRASHGRGGRRPGAPPPRAAARNRRWRQRKAAPPRPQPRRPGAATPLGLQWSG